MILREFSLDAPTLSKKERNDFGLQTRCMSSLYERSLNQKVITDGIWKVQVRCVPDIKSVGVKNLLGVATIEREFDFNDYNQKDDVEKKKMAVQVLHEGVIQVADFLGWPTLPFDNVLQHIKDLGYENQWVWKKTKRNPSRKLLGEIFCIHDLYSFDIWMRIRRAVDGAVLTERCVIQEIPDEFIFSSHLGSFRWLGNNTLELSSKDDTVHYRIEVNDKAVS